MTEERLIDPTGSYFTESNKAGEEWQKLEDQRSHAETLGLGDEVDLGSLTAEIAVAEDKAEKAQEATPSVTPQDLKSADHSGYDRLSLGTTFNKAERHNLVDPRWKHVYDTNQDGVVDGRDEYGRDWMNFGKKRNATDIYLDRKHAYTSGTGEADAETNLIEAKNAIAGTSLDLIQGLLTLPETTIRTLNGEKWDEQQLWFDPMKMANIENPYNGTSFGHLSRVIGGFVIGGMGAEKLLMSKFNWYNNLRNLKYGGGTLQNIISEVAFMKTSVYRQDPTAFNALQDQLYKIGPAWGDALNWIAVGEYDHPIVKEVKGLAEAGGIPALFGALFIAGRGAVGYAKARHYRVAQAKRIDKISDAQELLNHVNSIESQKLDSGINQLELSNKKTELPPPEQLPKGNDRYPMNSKIGDNWQGAETSTNKLSNIYRQLDLDMDLPSGIGSSDSPMTGLEAAKAAENPKYTEEFLKNKAQELLGESYFKGLIKDLDAQNLNFTQVFRPAFERFQEIIGREAGEFSVEEFWEPLLRDYTDASGKTDYKSWALEHVVTADIVNNALFKDLRTRARAARVVNDVGDIFSIDGPMKSISDRLIFGLTSVKRARYIISEELARLSPGERLAAVSARTSELHSESVDGVRLMMQFLKQSDSQELAQGILEVFSMSNKIHNWKDFDAWMRQKIIGGDFANKHKEGVLTKELGGVMVNSILSGVKTPLRAIMGTTANAYLNEVATLLGARIDSAIGSGSELALKSSAASTHAMFQLIPDAFKVFKTNLDSYFNGDLASIKSRFSSYTKSDENWDLMGTWVERNGTDGEKAAYYIANQARRANDSRLLSWSSRVLGATDDTFRWLLSKARARKKALLSIMQENPGIEVTPQMLKKAEDYEFARLHDSQGNIDVTKDAFLEHNFREVTLTTELQGFSKDLDLLMKKYPLTKPFFLFARTGINGLRVSVKNLPIVGAIMKESRDILAANSKALKSGDLLKYGIETADDLASAKHLIYGRQAIGAGVVTTISGMYLAGNLTGNGPADASMRKMWIDTGWQPRSIKIGGVWLSYDSFEPFNLVMANVADVGDNLELMGPQFAEERLQLIVAALGKGATSKTYLQGLGQLFDLLSGNPGYAANRTIANLVNNQMPLAGMRNDLANLINPAMRELDASFWDHIRNRNPLIKGTLPIRYDALNGKPIRGWMGLETIWNVGSPVAMRLDRGPGRKLLWNSNYDMRIMAYSAPDGTSLRRSPLGRSAFQKALGDRNVEAKLNELASRPEVKASIEAMLEDIRLGRLKLDPMRAYLHNRLISNLIRRESKIAWGSLWNHPVIKELMAEQRKNTLDNTIRLRETMNLPK
mgnify:FL=1